MRADDAALIRASWPRVADSADEAAALFYRRLFELDATAAALFARADLVEQGRKLMQMLAVAVDAVSDLEQLAPAVESLGRRHVVYGVQDAQYETVEAALLWMLARILGEAMTPATRAAWRTIYGELAAIMRRGALGVTATTHAAVRR